MGNYFRTLNEVDVSSFIEKKKNLSYLAWAHAWREVKLKFPKSYYTIYERPDGVFYWTDGRTAWVKTGVTIVDGEEDNQLKIEHIEYLPVMDFKNTSIPLEKITSMDVNKAIQRSLTKACARHGLGLYVYAGEDLPFESADDKERNEATCKEIITKIKTVVDEIKALDLPSDTQATLRDSISDIVKKYAKTKLGKPTADYRVISDVEQALMCLEDLENFKQDLSKVNQ